MAKMYERSKRIPLAIRPRRSDASTCSMISGSSPSPCNSPSCQRSVNCVPWFTHKYPRNQPSHQGENMVVNSLASIMTENAWYRLEVQGQTPLRRTNHAAVMVGRRMLVVGGISSGGILNDVHELHADLGEWRTWSLRSSESDPKFAGHSLVFWERKLLVIGAQLIEPRKQTMAVHAFDWETHRWRNLNLNGEVPMSRIGQSIVHVGSMLIMFGGEDARGQLWNDVHIFDLKTLAWLPSSTTGTRPCPRKGHSAACYAKRYLWIFGGKSRTSCLNDVHCLDLRTMEWVGTKAKGNVIPRAGHASVIVGHKWYIVGGEYNGREVIGTLVFDLPSQAWSVVTTVAPNSPLANDGISLVKIQHNGRNFLMTYGGHGFAPSNQVYVMLLPMHTTHLQTFQLKAPSRLSTLLYRLINGKAPGRKIRHPGVHEPPRPSFQSGSPDFKVSLPELWSFATPLQEIKEVETEAVEDPRTSQGHDPTAVVSRPARAWKDVEKKLEGIVSGRLTVDGSSSSHLTSHELKAGLPQSVRINERLRQQIAAEVIGSSKEIDKGIGILLCDKQEIEGKLQDALKRTDKLQQDILSLRRSKVQGRSELIATLQALNYLEYGLDVTSRLHLDADRRLTSMLGLELVMHFDGKFASRLHLLQEQVKNNENKEIKEVEENLIAAVNDSKDLNTI